MRVSLFGLGELGHALLSEWLQAGADRTQIRGVDPDAARAREIADAYGITTVSARAAASEADIAVLAVPPESVGGLLAEIGDALEPDCLILSMAAAVTTAMIEQHLRPGTAVIRATPNSAVSVCAGLCVLSAGRDTDTEHLLRAERLLRPIAAVIRVPEAHQDAASALSGSAPAYLYEVLEHMVNAGIRLGLGAEAAESLALHAVMGAAAIAQHAGHSPAHLRDALASPGTAARAALDVFADRQVGQAIEAAIEAAADRSAQLGSALAARFG